MLHAQWVQPPNDYPTHDDKPMGETEIHRDLIIDLLKTLERHFRQRDNVHVTGNLLWFYRENDRRSHLTPDIMVIFGVPKGRRENYLQWQEGPLSPSHKGSAPQVVMEISSTSTVGKDWRGKFFRYEDLGVEEYYLFDPREGDVTPRLRAYHRRGGKFIPVLGESVYSPRLELELVRVGETLRLRCPATGKTLLTPDEMADAAEARAERLAARLRELGIEPD